MNKWNRWEKWTLICIAAGCALRFVGLTRGTSDFVLPEQRRAGISTAFYSFHPDEKMIVDAALKPVDLLNPPFTVYGMLPVYLLRGTLKTAALVLGWEEPAFASPRSTHRIYYATRSLAALLSCLTLWLVWKIGERYFGRPTGLLALLFVGLSPGAIQQAHFFIVDGALGLASLAALFALLRSLETGKRSWYALAGALIGTTAAVKLTGGLLGLVLLLGHLTKGAGEKEHQGSASPGRRILDPRLWLAAGAALLVLLTIEPFLVADPGLLWQNKIIGDFGASLEVARGERLSPWTLADVHTTPYLHHWFHLFPLIAGWPLTLAFIAGAGYVLCKREWPGLLMLLWSGLYFGLIGGLHAKHVRYLVPLIPFFGLFTADLCVRLCRRDLNPISRRAGRIASAALLLYTLVYGLAFTRIYREEDSRVQAGRWIAQHLPAGSKLGVESGGFSMTNLISEKEYQIVRLNTSQVFYVAPYTLCSTQAAFFRERLSYMDYLVVTDANRVAQFTAVPDLFPAVADLYRQLLDEQLGFRRMRRFKTYPELLGIRFKDDGAEPSFLGYDHPAVIVFERKQQPQADQDFARWARGLQTDPRCADRRLEKAAAALRQGDLEKARRLSEELAETHPLSKLTHFLKAEIYRRQGKSKLAAAALRDYEPQKAQGLTAYVDNVGTIPYIPGATALSLAELGLPTLALQVLREGMEVARSYPAAIVSAYYSYLDVANHFAKKGQIDRMEQVLHMAIQLHRDEDTYNILAMLAYQRGESTRAMKLWTHSLSVDERQADIHAKLGKLTLQELEDYERALHHFERAVEIDAGLGAELEQWIFNARRKAPEQKMRKER